MSMIPNLAPALGEIILAIGAMALLIAAVVLKNLTVSKLNKASAMLILIALLPVLLWQGGTEVTFGGSFIQDGFAVFMKTIVMLAAAAALLMSSQYLKLKGIKALEFPILMVLATLGMMMMISASTLLSLYMGLELQSLSLYVLAAINRNRDRSIEAGLKYFVLGAVSSGILLYGISLVYGFTGTIVFADLAGLLAANSSNIGLIIGMVFILAGLAFKISAVPFHMWTPDVYEGAPTPVTAFFAAAPKVAAMALMMRVTITTFPALVGDWQMILTFLAVASMVLGAFAALVQTNIKRLMAYSSIGHIGYALVGLAAGTAAGVEGVLIYMAIYATMTLGTFACILSMRDDEGMTEKIADLAGLSRTRPALALALAIFMFSLAGIPTMAGFFGKWFVFKAAVDAGLYTLAVIGVVTSVVAAYYYLRIVKLMYFDEPAPDFAPVTDLPKRYIIAITAALNSPLSLVFIGLLVSAAVYAAGSFFPS
ncbi:MAG: NADH-quinone oxidoreductase subunit NuoN [Alphaproteobacteria bacterium]|nr:MAG: NADH-quinone oxidoreductase subunit NuoN [Alphaproteobacteria bacterium]